MTTTVKQLLQKKGPTPAIWGIAPQASVYEALRLMADKDVGALLVLENGQLVGILSERDYARRGVLQGKTSKDTPVREMMTAKVISVSPEQTIEACMTLMTNKNIRHLPVLNANQVMGVISIRDVVTALLADREMQLQRLERQVTGRRDDLL